MKKEKLEILYEDEDLIVVVKPVGMVSQSVGGLEMDMVSAIRNYLSTSKKGLYVGVIHRLDKPVSGIMVFAKNKNTSKWLSKQVSDRKMQKRYQAVVCGKIVDKCGQLEDFLQKSGKENRSEVSGENGKRAILQYAVMEHLQRNEKDYTRIEITLVTGRHHQIRVQFANAGFPLLGDRKYGSDASGDLALKSVYLRFYHEAKKAWLEFTIDGISWH